MKKDILEIIEQTKAPERAGFRSQLRADLFPTPAKEKHFFTRAMRWSFSLPLATAAFGIAAFAIGTTDWFQITTAPVATADGWYAEISELSLPELDQAHIVAHEDGRAEIFAENERYIYSPETEEWAVEDNAFANIFDAYSYEDTPLLVQENGDIIIDGEAVSLETDGDIQQTVIDAATKNLYMLTHSGTDVQVTLISLESKTVAAQYQIQNAQLLDADMEFDELFMLVSKGNDIYRYSVSQESISAPEYVVSTQFPESVKATFNRFGEGQYVVTLSDQGVQGYELSYVYWIPRTGWQGETVYATSLQAPLQEVRVHKNGYLQILSEVDERWIVNTYVSSERSWQQSKPVRKEYSYLVLQNLLGQQVPSAVTQRYIHTFYNPESGYYQLKRWNVGSDLFGAATLVLNANSQPVYQTTAGEYYFLFISTPDGLQSVIAPENSLFNQ